MKEIVIRDKQSWSKLNDFETVWRNQTLLDLNHVEQIGVKFLGATALPPLT